MFNKNISNKTLVNYIFIESLINWSFDVFYFFFIPCARFNPTASIKPAPLRVRSTAALVRFSLFIFFSTTPTHSTFIFHSFHPQPFPRIYPPTWEPTAACLPRAYRSMNFNPCAGRRYKKKRRKKVRVHTPFSSFCILFASRVNIFSSVLAYSLRADPRTRTTLTRPAIRGPASRLMPRWEIKKINFIIHSPAYTAGTFCRGGGGEGVRIWEVRGELDDEYQIYGNI